MFTFYAIFPALSGQIVGQAGQALRLPSFSGNGKRGACPCIFNSW